MGVPFGCMHPPKAIFSKKLEYFSYLYRAERIRPQGDMGGGNLGSQILEVRFSKDCRKTPGILGVPGVPGDTRCTWCTCSVPGVLGNTWCVYLVYLELRYTMKMVQRISKILNTSKVV